MLKKKRPRVVLDTSTMVSGIIGGVSARVLERWKHKEFEVIISKEMFKEYTEVLSRPKFGFPPQVVNDILSYVRHSGKWVIPHKRLNVVADDPADNKFLEAALEGKADFILSGDHHLLELKEFEGIPIVSSREFLEILGS